MMRQVVLILFLVNVHIYLHAQVPVVLDTMPIVDEHIEEETRIIDPIPPNMPHPIGGYDSLWCQLERGWNRNIIDSYTSKGMVLIQFVIDTLGQVRDVITNPHPQTKRRADFINDSSLSNELIKAYSSLPNWKPELYYGESVNVKRAQLIRFPYQYRCKTANQE